MTGGDPGQEAVSGPGQAPAPASEVVVTSYADLAGWLGGDVPFTTELLRLAGAANWRQLSQLQYAFPREVNAYMAWSKLTDAGRVSPGPTASVLASAVAAAELHDASVRVWAGNTLAALVKALTP